MGVEQCTTAWLCMRLVGAGTAATSQIHLHSPVVRLIIIVWMAQPYTLAQPVTAAGDDEHQSMAKCPIFEGVMASFTTWLITFTAWIAWKKPVELGGILSGTHRLPRVRDAEERTKLKLLAP